MRNVICGLAKKLSGRIFYRGGALLGILSVYLVFHNPETYWVMCPLGTLGFVLLYFLGNKIEAGKLC